MDSLQGWPTPIAPPSDSATLVRIAMALEEIVNHLGRIADRLEAADARYDAEQAGYEAATAAFDQKLSEVMGVPA